MRGEHTGPVILIDGREVPRAEGKYKHLGTWLDGDDGLASHQTDTTEERVVASPWASQVYVGASPGCWRG